MSLFSKFFGKANIGKVNEGIDPYFLEIRKEQIPLYQRYFEKVIQSIDVDTQTNWSMSKPYDKNQFRKDEDVMESIILGEATQEGLSPAFLQVIVHQYFFADVYEREKDKGNWVNRVMNTKKVDYFPGGWQVKKLLEAVSE
jgi:hypothetical protein